MKRKGMIIFDLDGTLTVPVLDFDAMRAEIGLPPGPILESLARLDEPARRRAEEIIHRHEEEAAVNSQLHPGAREAVAALRADGWPVAILTRNARQWAQVVLTLHDVQVDALCTRDDGVVKPSPEPILRLCENAGRDPRRSWMVGDHLFDLQSGRAAGCTTVLMLGDLPDSPYAEEADHVIRNLGEIVSLIKR